MSEAEGEDRHFADADALAGFGEALAPHLAAGDLIALSGGLGMGKTTLARGILRGLGYAGEAPSPTFAIVQGYEPPEVRLPVAHVDLYRLDDPAALAELGLDDWRQDGALIVEWPEHGGDMMSRDALHLFLASDPAGGRRLTARVPTAWKGRWPIP